MYLIYKLLSWPLALLLSPWLLYRALRGRLPGLGQRLGLIPSRASGPGPVIWLHAVSLGEVKAAAPLLGELRAHSPQLRFVLTTSTQTGWQAAREILSPDDVVLFPPFDLTWICRRFLRRIRPHALLVMETELWPNLFREAKRAGVPLLLVNGRISDRAFPRYHASRFFWRRVLEQPDRILAQSKRDADRFLALGAPPAKVEAAGNLKYAIRPSFAPIVPRLRALAEEAGAGPILVAGSTMPGEEKFLLTAFGELQQEFPRLCMILAPRHPQRFAAVAAEIRAAGIPFERRSALPTEPPASSSPPRLQVPGVLLLDSIGELGAVYELADVAFVGGTLVPTGGHNILEPARFGKPTLIGPSMSNFQDIADAFLRDSASLNDPIPEMERARVGAVIQIPDPPSLTLALRHLFSNPALCRSLGEAARSLVENELNPMGHIRRELERFAAPRAVASGNGVGGATMEEARPLHEARE